MYIPDPMELMDSQMEEQIALVDKDGKYPCCYCGEKHGLEDMMTISAHPAAPLMCASCCDNAESPNHP